MELKIEHLSKRFKDKTAVDDVSLTLTSGVWGLLGANGAGKTTLMRMIADIMVPTNGAIYYDGKDIHEMGKAYRELFGFLPQDFGYSRDFTVKDYLEYMAALKDVPARETSRKINHLLDILTLSDVKRKKIAKLSGGMKRRVGIAQAMLNDPKILVMDEPTAGLDPKERVRFRNLISDFAEDKIVILSTHIVSDVSYIADTILMMKDGTFLLQEPMATITDSINGKVWELLVSDREAAEYSRRFSVVNLHHENGNVRLRMIHDTSPAADAITVPPSLEDLFLYHFGEEAGEERGE